ncbi:MAG: hypothetical protein EXS02_01030 [Planctomycetes bacterium]|nr:hypothetical protein [Planctomycetota bacterium]
MGVSLTVRATPQHYCGSGPRNEIAGKLLPKPNYKEPVALTAAETLRHRASVLPSDWLLLSLLSSCALAAGAPAAESLSAVTPAF